MPTKQLVQFSFAANTERQSKVKAQRGRSNVGGTRLQEACQGKEGLDAAAAAASPVTPSITYNPSIPCNPEHPLRTRASRTACHPLDWPQHLGK